MYRPKKAIAGGVPATVFALTLSTYASAQNAPQAAPPAAPQGAPAAAPAPAAPAASTAAPAPAPAAPAAPAAASPEADTGDHLAPNSVYVEGLGAAILYSINYERVIADQVAVRGGFAYFSASASANDGAMTTSSASSTYVFIPITASYLGIRSGKHALELGAGATLLFLSGSANAAGVSASSSGVVPFGVAMVGYRFHPVGHAGFQFRIGFNALFGQGIGLQNPDPTKIGYIPFPYLSLGASF